MKGISVHIRNMWTKQLCNHKVWVDFVTAFRMRKRSPCSWIRWAGGFAYCCCLVTAHVITFVVLVLVLIGKWGSEAFRIVLRGYASNKSPLDLSWGKASEAFFFSFLATTARSNFALFPSALERDSKEENTSQVCHFENGVSVAWYHVWMGKYLKFLTFPLNWFLKCLVSGSIFD